MSYVVLGLSHQDAPISLLESVALDDEHADLLADRIAQSDHVSEVVVVSTCNRTEVYADAATFHGAVADISAAIADVTGADREQMHAHFFVHFEDRAVAHAFTVASGLDSMAVGEAQILGQLRASLTSAQRRGQVGPSLNSLMQQALRVGKRAHSETAIDTVSHSLVDAGLTEAGQRLRLPLDQAHVLVVGAGAMSALAATTAHRQGAGTITIVNRSEARGLRLAARVEGTALAWAELPRALADADIVITCTGASGRVVDLATAADAQVARGGRPQVYIDLALPHDVATEVDQLSSVTRLGLDALGEVLSGGGSPAEVDEVRDLITGEVAAFLAERSGAQVGPTVAALRGLAAEVVESEITRLFRRVPDLTEAQRDQVSLTVNRVVDKLLHTPTVRVKQLAGDGVGGSYAQALSELFDLDPRQVATVSASRQLPQDKEAGR